ncbi:hypothetical protein RHSIM_Rhsim07G0164800 [Rhododendron simsii]|uniref:Uncharacterized protein n=1 Tax=Rhododendron simsii TaxID=118357 RepID=A0A834GSW0_RHOSS|nr:hypothetical protein RHSIM_Rhsim07G0164800 [Rhododendron simsii]
MEYEWMINWGVLAEEWLEREAIELHAQNQPEPGNEMMGAFQNNDEWLMAYVDHKDPGNQKEWEWIPTPNEWQMLEEEDPLDYVTLPLLFIDYEKKDDPLDTFSLSHLFGHETRLSLNEINRQHQAMNVFGKEYNSDPSKFIVPDTEPKPIVYVPEEPEVLFLGSFEMENRHLMEGWYERETVEFLMGGEPTVGDETWSDFVQNWESFQANPLDGYSLYGLFQEPEPVEEEERLDEELHSFVPPMTFDESSRGHFEDAHHTGHEEYAAFDTNQFIQDDPGQPMVETVFEDIDWFPQAYIIGESLPRPAAPFPPQPDIAMLEHTPFDNFWDEDEVMDIQVRNGEVWTVNKAMIDDSF